MTSRKLPKNTTETSKRRLDVAFSEEPFSEEPFSEEQCTALFQAVLVHDDLYPEAKLPDKITLNYSEEQLNNCFKICLQLWQQGVDRKKFKAMIIKIYHQQALNPDEQLAFKYMRARFKHLRFAYGMLNNTHKYPLLFHIMIALMGYLQDAFKNNQKFSVKTTALVLRFFLSKVPYAVSVKKVYRFKLATPASFQSFVLKQIKFIRSNLEQEEVTSKVFHEMRIVISRLVALYDNLKTLYPSEYHNSISEYLSTLNGMMGGLHDKLIARKFNKTQNYNKDTFKIPGEIRHRLIILTKSFNA